jgi:hypothetical protein
MPHGRGNFMSDITYAPFVKPVTAKRNLCGVALQWTDNAGPTVESVTNATKYAASTFARLSGNQLTYTVSAYQVAVPYTHTSTNVPAAGSYAKAQLEKEHGLVDADTSFILVNNNAPGENYSYTKPGGNTSNLLNVLDTTFCHELGRQTPCILGSSGAYENGKYVDQADATTFMGHFASDSLTASQLYYLGWLVNTQVATYDATSGVTGQFTIVNLEVTNTSDIKAVMITGATNNPLFLSRPTLPKNGVMFALHLPAPAQSSGQSNNRGSQRIDVFGKTYTYAGLVFTLVSSDDNSAIVTIARAT